MLNLYDKPNEIYSNHKELLEASRIWKQLNEVISLSFLKEWDKSIIEYINRICPSVKFNLTTEPTKTGKITKKCENAIRNYLLEKPGILEYFFQEIMTCFAEVIQFKKGIGGKPDLILGQQSHRGEPRHYLVVELKLPNEPIEKYERKLSDSFGTSLLQSFNRRSHGYSNPGFFNTVKTPEIDFLWLDYMIIASSQVYCGAESSIPIKYFKKKKTNKDSNNESIRESNTVLTFKDNLPFTLHSYDDLRRPIMRDIIAMGPRNFDKWIETKSDWIRSTTKKFTKKHDEVKTFNPYL